MRIRMNMIIAIMITFCFTATLFMIIPIRSANSPYDPWVDINDDGQVSLQDLVLLANSYGTTGTPINKTALLLELQTEIDALNTTIIEQQNTINNLNQTVVYLNETVTILNSTGLGAPDYDSGWQSITVGSYITLTHNLNTTELLVYLIGKEPGGWIHQYRFGGGLRDLGGNQDGAWWTASNTTICLWRSGQDNGSNLPWQYVRVMIWKIPQP